jgi:flagellar biosynthesis/type III secretory pathway ATPase
MFWASGTGFYYIAENFRSMEKMAKNFMADNTVRGLIGETVREVDDAIAGEVK